MEADAGLGSLRDLLRKAVAQEVGNRPPVAVATPDHAHEVPWGMDARVQLTAAMTTDPDSTPGTTNNIRSYRWLDARGWVLGTEPDVIVELSHGRRGIAEHAITLEVTDAYGAVGRATTRVTVIGVRPAR